MIHIKKYEIKYINLTSTKRFDTDTFLFIATNGTNKENVEINIIRSGETHRYDIFKLDFQNLDIELGYYDYVIIDREFNESFDTILDIKLAYPDNIVEIGKMLVSDKYGNVPNSVYDGETSQRKTYKS